MTLFDNFHRPVTVFPWDGVTPWGRCLPFSPDGLYIDTQGNIWYTIKDGSNTSAIWCYADNLEFHVHRLEQIQAR